MRFIVQSTEQLSCNHVPHILEQNYIFNIENTNIILHLNVLSAVHFCYFFVLSIWHFTTHLRVWAS
jgi:hypothetical protein